MSALAARIGTGVGALAAIGLAVSIGLGIGADIEQAVEDLMGRQVSADVAQKQASDRNDAFEASAGNFERAMAKDADHWGLEVPSLESMMAAADHVELIRDSKVLKPGGVYRSDELVVRAETRKVAYQNKGATVKARHVVATIENVSGKPLAYFAELRSAQRGDCPVRARIAHNVSALMPGDRAEVVVCAGSGGVEILQLEALTITPLGYGYISQVPPQAFGHDKVRSGDHESGDLGGHRIETCSQVPAMRIQAALRNGSVRWRDVADFYARHNCERQQFFMGYEIPSEPLAALPATPGGG